MPVRTRISALILAFFDMMREWVTLVVAITLAYYRNAPAVHSAIGSVACCAIAKILKLLIKQNRPFHSNSNSISSSKPRKTSYGMPSTHSAAVMYFASYLVYILNGLESSHRHALSALAVLVIALGSVGALSRVFNGHHTLPQVLAGSFLGVSFATVWWNIRLTSYVYIDHQLGNFALYNTHTI